MKSLLALGIALAAMTTAASAATVNLDTSYLGTIYSTTNGGANDPFPNELVCIDADNTCSIKSKGDNIIAQSPEYEGTGDIRSPALWKGEASGAEEGALLDASKVTFDFGAEIFSGLITVDYTEGDLLSHYLAVKAGDEYHLFEILISSLEGVADLTAYTIAWDLDGYTTHGMSHVSLYNTGETVVPLPPAIILLLSALAGLLGLGRIRKGYTS